MFSTFSTALSALKADSSAIDVVGNNLANLNTVGYKAKTLSFREMIAASMGAGNDVGIGVDRPTETRVFTQGNIGASSGLFDVAIRGAGFLVVKDDLSQTYYTRAGNLQVDKAGNLRTSSGDAVQGWATDTMTGAVQGDLGNLAIPVSSLTEPSPTSKVSITANLDANSLYDPLVPTTFSTPLQVYDTMGGAHNLKVVFTKQANPGEWTFDVYVPAADLGQATDQLVDVASNTIQFDAQGKVDPSVFPAKVTLSATTTTTASGTGITFPNGATLNDLEWSTTDEDGNGMLTQFAQASALSANSQDGQAPGRVLNFSIQDGGKIVARVSNGPARIVGMLALAQVQNPETMEAVGDNKYQLTDATALPAIGVAGTGGRGEIAAGSLESSTVDIAGEFTNLIVYQRGYQANSKIVTTLDELSQDTINLKR